MVRVGVLAGTGLDRAPLALEPLTVETPWRDVTVGYARDGDLELFLVPRHGDPPSPPHAIDHKANVEALARCGVTRILALANVGSLVDTIHAGTLVVPDDFMDHRARKVSFFDDKLVHVDVSEAYCPTLRTALVRAGRKSSARTVDGGVYAATEGPRLETRAEVRGLRAMGGTIVGMTGAPEASLARERALCYASLCVVANHASGVADETATARDIQAQGRALAEVAWGVILDAARGLPAERSCACGRALEGATL